MIKAGFMVICNHCGNTIDLRDNFIRDQYSIYIGTFMSCDITCNNCENSIDENEDD
jgi:ribosomal protein S27E